MAQKHAKPFKVLVPKVRQTLDIDAVVGERPGVLTEAKSVQPLRDILGHPAASTLFRFRPKFTVGGRSCLSMPKIG